MQLSFLVFSILYVFRMSKNIFVRKIKFKPIIIKRKKLISLTLICACASLAARLNLASILTGFRLLIQ